MIAPAESRVTENSPTSSKRRSRERRRLERERQRRHESRFDGGELALDETPHPEAADAPAAAAADDPKPEAHVRPGLFKRLFGRGERPDGRADVAAAPNEQTMPSLLRPIARREYGHERTLSTIRQGFEDLSDLMCDIRDGLEASVEKQAELLDQLRFLPVIAEQNARSGERLERQLQAQNSLQAETLKSVREQARGQSAHHEQLGRVLGTMGKEARDQKREIDDVESRLERMRHSEQAIAANLSTVGTAVRKVSEQSAAQANLSAGMQRALDERTRELETSLHRQSRRQGALIALASLLATLAVTGVATIGYLYLKQAGAL